MKARLIAATVGLTMSLLAMSAVLWMPDTLWKALYLFAGSVGVGFFGRRLT